MPILHLNIDLKQINFEEFDNKIIAYVLNNLKVAS
jgi:hypothetical protein